ncbi:hypothetical protein EAI89_08665 [Eubacterium sp. am_0171]|nr:hypothetical protein EAI89_08665 [Eubacterium sp. am_0171]
MYYKSEQNQSKKNKCLYILKAEIYKINTYPRSSVIHSSAVRGCNETKKGVCMNKMQYLNSRGSKRK